MSFREAGIRLIDCVHKTPAAQLVGYPYVAIPQMKNGRVDFSDARRISHADFVEWTKKARPQVHDVVLSRRTNPGVTATFGTDVDFALGQNLVLLRADGAVVNPEFLRWLVVCPDWWAEIEKYNNVGAVFDSLKCADVPNFRLPIPAKPVQISISELLGSMDDKIELNRRMNETLEAMAQAIFRDWFVDFGPVRRKLAGATDPVAIMGGLMRDPASAAELARLFPDVLSDADVPEGWSEPPLSEHLEIIGGGTPKTSNPAYWGGDVPWFSVVDTPSGSDVFVFDTEKTITPAGLAGSSVRLIPAGTTIISARGTVGNLAIAGQDMTFNQSCYALQSARGEHPCFVYLLAAHAVDQLRSMAHGSVFSTITRQTFDAMSFASPPLAVLEGIEGLLSPLFLRIKAAVAENRTLAETRDYLLPRLMSGEVRVQDSLQIAKVVA
jgi:type I restriction enzyme S subunit